MKDIYDDQVKNALEKENWQITKDKLVLKWVVRDLYILGTEKLIAAEKTGQKIAVGVKSFISNSPITDLEKALRAYILYYDILQQLEPNRHLYFPILQETYTYSD